MAEQTFKSPGFFENEVDLSQRESSIVGVPAGVIGTAEMGPAFVPVTVGSFADFQRRFGSLDPDSFGPYAVREFLKNRTALTYMRVLGAGANTTTTDIALTETQGTVKGAGFIISGSRETNPNRLGSEKGAVQFLVGRHYVSASFETIAMPEFTDNDSFDVSSGNDKVYLVRGMIMCATGTRMGVLDFDKSFSEATGEPGPGLSNCSSSVVFAGGPGLSDGMADKFKLVISSSSGAAFDNDEGFAGLRILTASYDPNSPAYIGNILNTDPTRFQEEEHLLYAHFPVEKEIAALDTGLYGRSGTTNYGSPSVGIVSGSSKNGVTGTGYSSTKEWLSRFGRYDTRYQTSRTTSFISQPFGRREYNLFHFESISDGAVANTKYKVAISNIKKSTNPQSDYGTFTVLVRNFDDTDTTQEIVEQYANCTLDPNSSDYVAKKLGDFKVSYNFDATTQKERRLVVSGKYPNVSSRVRIVMSNDVIKGDVPAIALPFGFRGIPALKTTNTLTDNCDAVLRGTYETVGNLQDGGRRLQAIIPAGAGHRALALTGSIVPPVPYRFKCSRGAISEEGGLAGNPGSLERSDSRLYWGCKFERVPLTGSITSALLQPNASSTQNQIFRNYSKMIGIQGMDTLVTGSARDEFNNNKFTLARVSLAISGNFAPGEMSVNDAVISYLTGTAGDHMREACYIRNARPTSDNYTIRDGTESAATVSEGSSPMLTLASLASLTSSIYFNKFVDYNKFVNFMYGGFDGVNILDRDMAEMNDRASSSDTEGKASIAKPATGGPLDIGLSDANNFGTGKDNAIVMSYRSAATIMTDPMITRINILSVPGIRDEAVTDFIIDKIEDYSKAIYIMDMPHYDPDDKRIFSGDNKRASVEKTENSFASRAVNSNYAATYFPDVTIEDPFNNLLVSVPNSVAVLGALAYSDSVSFPWFAPAGFSRASLDFVTNVSTRLNTADRDTLYEARINPIATFPNAGFVIFGQKTLQQSKSALDRVNVRRMMLEVKRQVVDVAEKILFEPNTPETRARFISQVTPKLALIQAQQGIDQFKVVMDGSNNTTEDIETNRLNGRIVVVPTRAIEFIVMDFIVTNSGVEFE
jgi:hypothetical protein